MSAETFKIPVDELELKTDSNYKQGSIENLYIPNKVNWLEIRPGGEISGRCGKAVSQKL